MLYYEFLIKICVLYVLLRIIVLQGETWDDETFFGR